MVVTFYEYIKQETNAYLKLERVANNRGSNRTS